MKWFSHITVAASLTAIVAPPLVPIAILGSTAPDWMERVYKYITGGRRLRHRGPTHYVAAWVVALLFGLLAYDYHHILAAFAFGGFTHVMCDALTVTGVPFSPLSDRRIHIFGGRISTGDNQEYMFTFFVFFACLCVVSISKHYDSGYAPFFFDWAGYYQDGLADASEWKTNRFRFF